MSLLEKNERHNDFWGITIPAWKLTWPVYVQLYRGQDAPIDVPGQYFRSGNEITLPTGDRAVIMKRLSESVLLVALASTHPEESLAAGGKH